MISKHLFPWGFPDAFLQSQERHAADEEG